MRYALLLVSLAFLPPATAFAQTDKKLPVTIDTCEALVSEVFGIERTPETTIEDAVDGCHLTQFYVGNGPYARYRIEDAVLTAPGLFEDFAAERPPAELDLTIKGFTIAPDTGSALNNYIIEMQSEPMDIHLAYRWDRDARTVELADFSVKANDYGSIRLAGRLSEMDFDLERLERLDTIPGAFDQLVIELDNARFFSTLTAPVVIGMLPYDEDPRPLIAAYQQSAIAFINGLPEETASGDSKAALETLVSTFPKLTGDYLLELRADPPLAFSSIDIDDVPDIFPLLQRLQLAVSHEPVEQP